MTDGDWRNWRYVGDEAHHHTLQQLRYVLRGVFRHPSQHPAPQLMTNAERVADAHKRYSK